MYTFKSLSMTLTLDEDSVDVSQNIEFMLGLTALLLGLFVEGFYFIHDNHLSINNIFAYVWIFFFIALLLAIPPQINSFRKKQNMLLWKADRQGFYFMASRSSFMSYKDPTFYPWSSVEKVMYANKYITIDSDLDKVTYTDNVLVFFYPKRKNKQGIEVPKALCYPGKIGPEVFEAIKRLAPDVDNLVFEKVDRYSTKETL